MSGPGPLLVAAFREPCVAEGVKMRVVAILVVAMALVAGIVPQFT